MHVICGAIRGDFSDAERRHEGVVGVVVGAELHHREARVLHHPVERRLGQTAELRGGRALLLRQTTAQVAARPGRRARLELRQRRERHRATRHRTARRRVAASSLLRRRRRRRRRRDRRGEALDAGGLLVATPTTTATASTTATATGGAAEDGLGAARRARGQQPPARQERKASTPLVRPMCGVEAMARRLLERPSASNAGKDPPAREAACPWPEGEGRGRLLSSDTPRRSQMSFQTSSLDEPVWWLPLGR